MNHEINCPAVLDTGLGAAGCDCKGAGKREPTYGMCTACGSVEVALNAPHGTRDLSYMGESPRYPVGYGCEVCA